MLSALGERSSSVGMASRRGWPCQGWSAFQGWGLAAVSWLLDKVSKLPSPQTLGQGPQRPLSG